MIDIFHRPALAQEMARQLLQPKALEQDLSSGLFMSGIRRTGKTTFLRQDLIPALENAGAVVIYVDLWTDTLASTVVLLLNEVKKAMRELETPGSGLLERFKRISAVDLGAAGFKFGIKLDAIGAPGGPTLAEAITVLVEKSASHVVIVVDEVQHSLSSEDGLRMMMALKAAREAINLVPGMPGKMFFIGTGSHRSLVGEMTTRRSSKQAFEGAHNIPYPVLDAAYLAHMRAQFLADKVRLLPAAAALQEGFRALGSRPESLLRSLRELQSADVQPADTVGVDKAFLLIAQVMRNASADIEFARVEKIGSLAVAIFERIANAEAEAKGLFSAEAQGSYSQTIGRDLRQEEIQPVLNALVDDNLVMRTGHGQYIVTDPFVRDTWRERQSIQLGNI
jgi:hypothetical protein